MAGREQTRADQPGAGWEALRERRWADARSAFEIEIARGETPEALEGLGWAAWWLDDEAAVFEARERAQRLYDDRGDALGAARVATWIAADELDFRGSLAVANGWLLRARRLLEPLPPAAEHGWLEFQAGYLDQLRGDLPAATDRALAAAELGRRLAARDVEMLGLALTGAVLVARGRVGAGMAALDEAAALALAGEHELPVSSAWTFCLLVAACVAVCDYGRAFEWCDRIAEAAERNESAYLFAFCRADYGALHLSSGRWSDAEAALRASLEGYERSRPALVGAPLAGLAELRRRQGRRTDALGLLERAGEGHAVHLCRARLALDAGDPRAAAELADRVLRQLGEPGAPTRAAALDILVRARIATGDGAGAAAAAAELGRLAEAAGTDALAAAAELAAGLVAAAEGEPDRGRALLEDAVDHFARAGAAFDAAQARLELAATLHASGRADAAAHEAAAALAVLDELDGPDARRARELAAGGEPPSKVTPRERDVLALLAEGMTNQQIAARLVVSEHTVHRHVTNILRKLELPSRAAAAAHAVRTGLVGERDP